MAIFYRKNIESCDILETSDEHLRTEFQKSAKTIGRFSTETGDTTAHILHIRPLYIGAISKSDSGRFHPESPYLYDKSTNCFLKGRHENSDYSIYECENMSGAYFHLDYMFPKIYPKENPVVLAIDKQKLVTEEKNMPGGVVTKLGTNEIYEIITEDGKIDVDELHNLYYSIVWPVAKLYYKHARSHFFTYFREYEIKHDLPHSGTKGTRFRNIYGFVYYNYYRTLLWGKIKRLFGFE